MKLVDLTGSRFGRLIVVSRAPNAVKETRWHCICDCGKSTIAFAQNLRRGLTKSCGCLRSEVNSATFTEDLTGRRFGSLTALRRGRDYVAPNGARHVRWECRCTCGRASTIAAADLRSGHTTTCGCHRLKHLFDVPHTLYRLYDDEGELLYIGITNRWDRRSDQHSRKQPWWPEVHSISRERFSDRLSAEEAEKAAIRSERPAFNRIRYQGR